jgi:hypothetical protein
MRDNSAAGRVRVGGRGLIRKERESTIPSWRRDLRGPTYLVDGQGRWFTAGSIMLVGE